MYMTTHVSSRLHDMIYIQFCVLITTKAIKGAIWYLLYQNIESFNSRSIADFYGDFDLVAQTFETSDIIKIYFPLRYITDINILFHRAILNFKK